MSSFLDVAGTEEEKWKEKTPKEFEFPAIRFLGIQLIAVWLSSAIDGALSGEKVIGVVGARVCIDFLSN